MNHENSNKLDHSPKEMVLQNLHKIKKCVECMMDIAIDNPESEDLILNHAWMVDHIATSSDDIQEACDFMCHRLGEESPSTHSKSSTNIDLTGLAQTFESYSNKLK